MTGLPAVTAVALAIARKDAMSELRGRHAAGSTLFFAALSCCCSASRWGRIRGGWQRRLPGCCGWRSCSAAC